MNNIYLQVQGMSCGGCVKRVTNALHSLGGVNTVAVDLPTGHVSVSGDFPQGSDSLVLALTAAGYPAKLTDSPAATGVGEKKSGGCCG